MKKFLLPAVMALTFVGCTVKGGYPADLPPPAYDIPVSSFSSSSEPEEEMQKVVLVDQTFESAASARGAARLKAMRAMKLKGDLSFALIRFELSRNGQNDGVSGVHIYTADLTEKGQIATSTEWTSFRVVGGSWLGNGKCQIAAGSELLSGKGETVTQEYTLDSLPISGPKPACEMGTDGVDLLSRINDTGIVLGFLPTNTNYHLKVTIEYRGTLEAKYW